MRRFNSSVLTNGVIQYGGFFALILLMPTISVYPNIPSNSRCKKATYCSRDCQVGDWKNGHKLECKKLHEKHGVTIPDKVQRKVEVQAENVTRASNEMFMDHTGWFLRFCIVNNVDALDCVVVMNFCAAPPTVDFQKASTFLQNNACGMRPGQRGHKSAKEAIAKHRANGAVTGISLMKPLGGATYDSSLAAIIKDFPGRSLRLGSWEASQKAMKERMVQEGWSDGLPYPIGGFTN